MNRRVNETLEQSLDHSNTHDAFGTQIIGNHWCQHTDDGVDHHGHHEEPFGAVGLAELTSEDLQDHVAPIARREDDAFVVPVVRLQRKR